MKKLFVSNVGLIDEYRVILVPLLLGRGNSMFPNMKQPVTLKLEKTKLLKSGVVVLYYQPR